MTKYKVEWPKEAGILARQSSSKRTKSAKPAFSSLIRGNVSQLWILSRGDLNVFVLSWRFTVVQFQSVQFLDQMGRPGDTTGDSADILSQSFLLKAVVSICGMDKNVHSLTLSIRHVLCRSRRRPFSTVTWRMVLERTSWRMICLNRVNFCLLTVATYGSCRPTRKLILLHTQLLVSCFI